MLLRPALIALACGSLLNVHAEGLDATAVVKAWQSQQLGRVQTLQASSLVLKDSVDALCKRLGNSEIRAARQAWLQTYVAWRAVEALPMGPALSRRTAWQIDAWPVKPQKVEEAVRLVERDAPIADSVGANAQGLPALEYLLWGDDRANAQLGRLHFRQRCQYAQALAADVASEAQSLQQDWQGYSSTALDTDAGRQAFEEAVNLIAGSVEALRDKKVGRLGSPKLTQKPTRQIFDAWRSHGTHAGMAATLNALEQLFLDNRQAPSFVDRLAVEKPLLAQHLREEFAIAREHLAKLPADMAASAAAKPASIQPFLDSIKKLQGIIELQVADAVGVTIGFKDSDGD
ncbi:MAG: imelysin family protein [Chitinimonas sp.]|nr:imelysin family protein [Chitinimonas sp.]